MKLANAKRDLKKALLEVFEVSQLVVDRSVWDGDPYQWSPSAVFTISTEQGIPSNYDAELMNLWEKVSDRIRHHGLFCEAVNGGVTAVHYVRT